MPIISGIYTPLTLDAALDEIIAAAPSSIVFAPGNPPELILANMFAQANVDIDETMGEIMALFLSPVGSMIDLMNPNNPRKTAVAASGYVSVTGPGGSGSPVIIPAGTIFTASNGQQYTTGTTDLTVPAGGSLDVPVTALETGIGGNIPSGQSFTISGISLTGTNPLPFLSGLDAETDAIYLNRLIGEKTEYGTQNGSVAVETEIKEYYQDAQIYVNNTGVELTTPVPVPGSGYNLIVKTPSGVLASADEIAQIFQTLSNRLEFVNSQNTGSALHVVLSGSVINSGIPLSYYFTVAQPVEMSISIEILIRASKNADTSELITQSNNFAVYFINRLMEMFSGINGTTDITYNDQINSPVVTPISIAGISEKSGTIAPEFGIGMIESLVNDIDTMGDTPLIIFDEVDSLTITIDPQVSGQSPIVLSASGGSSKTFIDFKNDSLFSDDTSFYDRFAFIDPTKISVTMKVSAWM
jgi:hypothetical protein